MSSGPRTTGYLYLQGNPKPIALFDKFQFGRMESFDNPAVSRMHFTIAANDSGVYFIIDHESRSGTSVDGKKIKSGQWCELQEGTLITVGPYVFEFTFKPAHKRPQVPAAKKADRDDSEKTPPPRRGKKGKISTGKLVLQNTDTEDLHLHKTPRVKSPSPKLPKEDHTPRKVSTDQDYNERLRLFLMICVVIIVATVFIVQKRNQTSREQMLPYYAGYMKVIKQYYKNYDQYQKGHRNISVYERDQGVLTRELREIEADLRVERPVDRKADYYKKHLLFLISKTHSHSMNTQKYFRTGKFSYFTQAKQDDVDLGQEMMILNSEFGLKHEGTKFNDPQSNLRVPAAVPQEEAPRQEPAPIKMPAKKKKARGKKSRAPF